MLGSLFPANLTIGRDTSDDRQRQRSISFFVRRIGTHLLVKQTPASALLAALDVAFASRAGV